MSAIEKLDETEHRTSVKKVPLILKLDTSGQPHEWITWENAVEYHYKGLVAWQLGDDDFTFYGGQSRLTGNQSTITTQSIIAVKGGDKAVRKKMRLAPPVSPKLLFRRDQHICAYCGHQFEQMKLTRDHIVPESKGGKSTWMNLVTACDNCNHRKGDKIGGQNGWELLYLPYIPHKNEYLILANRNILADQMDFLLAGVPKHSRLFAKEKKGP